MMEAGTGLPLVSVVIPCFNAESYLAEAIESVLAQEFQSTEIIVVDDGSTDTSAEVAGSYGARIELIRQRNTGISGARNSGIARARGHLLAFLDADDLWPKGSLAARVGALDRQPNLDCVFGDMEQFFSPDANPAAYANLRVDLRRQACRMSGSMLIRRAALNRIGPFDTGLAVAEMVEWLGRADRAGLRIGTVDELVLRRRIHATNTSLRSNRSSSDFLRALKSTLDLRRSEPREAKQS